MTPTKGSEFRLLCRRFHLDTRKNLSGIASNFELNIVQVTPAEGVGSLDV